MEETACAVVKRGGTGRRNILALPGQPTNLTSSYLLGQWNHGHFAIVKQVL